MARATPTIRDGTLAYRQDGTTRTLAVGSPDWDAWLAEAPGFAFVCAAGRFTARKERAGNGRGGWYWKAYRRQEGQLRKAYLGRAEELTPERLARVAAQLASGDYVAGPSRPAPSATGQDPELPDDLLQTKLFAPLPRPGVVPRPRLLARLAAGLRGPVTLLAAPAGAGKTTLLSAWGAAATGGGARVAWLALDAAT